MLFWYRLLWPFLDSCEFQLLDRQNFWPSSRSPVSFRKALKPQGRGAQPVRPPPWLRSRLCLLSPNYPSSSLRNNGPTASRFISQSTVIYPERRGDGESSIDRTHPFWNTLRSGTWTKSEPHLIQVENSFKMYAWLPNAFYNSFLISCVITVMIFVRVMMSADRYPHGKFKKYPTRCQISWGIFLVSILFSWTSVMTACIKLIIPYHCIFYGSICVYLLHSVTPSYVICWRRLAVTISWYFLNENDGHTSKLHPRKRTQTYFIHHSAMWTKLFRHVELALDVCCYEKIQHWHSYSSPFILCRFMNK